MYADIYIFIYIKIQYIYIYTYVFLEGNCGTRVFTRQELNDGRGGPSNRESVDLTCSPRSGAWELGQGWNRTHFADPFAEAFWCEPTPAGCAHVATPTSQRAGRSFQPTATCPNGCRMSMIPSSGTQPLPPQKKKTRNDSPLPKPAETCLEWPKQGSRISGTLPNVFGRAGLNILPSSMNQGHPTKW